MPKKQKFTVLVGEEHLSKIANEPDIGLDLETSGFSPFRDKIAVVSIKAPKSNIELIIHCRGKISKRLKEWIETRKRITNHNLVSFDFPFLIMNGVQCLKPKAYDTMLGELALLTSDRRDVSVNLKSTMYRRTGIKVSKDVDHSGWMGQKLSASQIKYCAEDVRELINLREAQLAAADEDQLQAIGVENDLIPIISTMTVNGIPIDVTKLKKFLVGQRATVKRLEEKLTGILGSINFGSHVQLKKALAAKGWELKSTAAEVLTDIAMYGGELGQMCEDIVEMRHAAQRVKMYQPKWVDKHVTNGLVHPKWWSISTDTGRFSSSDCNMQQVPKDMRPIFGGVPGHKMVWCDYSQAEIRMAAAVANCPGLKAAFAAGLHVHKDIASKSFGVPYEEVDDSLKQLAKGLTFTMLFGGSWGTFQLHAKQAGVSLSDDRCIQIFEDFFRAYPGMAELKRRASNLCRKHQQRNIPLPLVLPTGLKRVLVNWKLKPSVLMNTMVQGGAASGMKFAMLECHRRGLTKYLCGTIHDELLACVPNSMAAEYAIELEEAMNIGLEQVMEDVKSEAVAKIGDYWG